MKAAHQARATQDAHQQGFLQKRRSNPMAPYGLYQLNPLTDPLFAWLDRTLSVRFDEAHAPCLHRIAHKKAEPETKPRKTL